jgi:hypothetical protein
MTRDRGIDLVRGAGILMIALDHLGGLTHRLSPSGFIVPFVTWSRIGWSSAAEFFVFFSGYLIGAVYLRTLQMHGPVLLHARAVHRAWQIYAANLLTFCVVLLITGFVRNDQLMHVSFAHILAGKGLIDPLVSFLQMRTAPMFFEILFLYVVMLLAAPALLLLARRSISAVMACSLAIWLCVQINPAINLARWNFNPFAWQLVFVTGMMFAVGGLFARIIAAVGRRRLLLMTGVPLVLAFVIKSVDKSEIVFPWIGQVHVPGIDKTSLAGLRLAHFGVSLLFVMAALPSADSLARSTLAGIVSRIGQHSLECFCMSTILVYGVTALLANQGMLQSMPVLLAGVVMVVLLCAWARAVEWIKAQPWRSNAPEKKAANHGQAVEPALAAGLRHGQQPLDRARVP